MRMVRAVGMLAVQPAPLRSIADLTALIYSHEARLLLSLQTDASLPSAHNSAALYTSKSGPRPNTSRSARGRQQQHGGYSQEQQQPPRPNGPRPDQKNQRSSRPNPDRDITCQVCYKKRHEAINCWYRSDLANYPE